MVASHKLFSTCSLTKSSSVKTMEPLYGSEAFSDTFSYSEGYQNNDFNVSNWTAEEPISPPVASAMKEDQQNSEWQSFLHSPYSSLQGWSTMPSQHSEPGVYVGRQSSAVFSGLSAARDSVFDNYGHSDQVQTVRNCQYRSVIAPNMISLPAVAAPLLSHVSPGNPYGVVRGVHARYLHG
ncbi:hypothetical protein CPB85DRAFT_870298 [Mucidula mucida]|nr:hypothetical protein CPB85DRAFT_870298 [Mucidula mucida]